MTRPADDNLLSVLDQLTNTIYWYNDRDPEFTATTAIIEALEDWLAEHSAEYHHSQPFTTDELPGDLLAAGFIELGAAVETLRRGARPGLTYTDALAEALGEWSATTSAEHHQSAPFQRPNLPDRRTSTSS